MSGTVLAVTSGKGGVGNTTTALNVSAALGADGHAVATDVGADLLGVVPEDHLPDDFVVALGQQRGYWIGVRVPGPRAGGDSLAGREGRFSVDERRDILAPDAPNTVHGGVLVAGIDRPGEHDFPVGYRPVFAPVIRMEADVLDRNRLRDRFRYGNHHAPIRRRGDL